MLKECFHVEIRTVLKQKAGADQVMKLHRTSLMVLKLDCKAFGDTRSIASEGLFLVCKLKWPKTQH